MESRPAVRGTFVKFLWRSVKHLEGPRGERIRAEFPVALRKRIREVPRLGWTDVSLFAETIEAVRLAGGPEGSYDVWHRCCRDCFEQPLVQPLARGATALFGRVPSALVRRTGSLWALVSRDCGEMHSFRIEEPNCIGFRAERLPTALRSEAFATMFDAGFQAQLDFLDYVGKVNVDLDNLSLGRVSCEVRWQDRRHNAPR